MKKNNIKKLVAILATANTLSLSGCVSKEDNSMLPYIRDKYEILDYSIEYGEDGCYTETFEVAPIIKYFMEPVSSTKYTTVDGKEVSEPTTTYVKRYIYAAPAGVTRVEGTGKNMRCFIDNGAYKATNPKDEDESLHYGFIYDKTFLDLGDGYYQQVSSGDIYRGKLETLDATLEYDEESNTNKYLCPSGCTLSGNKCFKTTIEYLNTIDEKYEPIRNAYYYYDSKKDEVYKSCPCGYYLDGNYCYDESIYTNKTDDVKKLVK